MPTRLITANSTNVGRYTFAARERSPKNGRKKTQMTAVTVVVTHGWMSRSRGQNVSSPRFPYQMTRYWPNVR